MKRCNQVILFGDNSGYDVGGSERNAFNLSQHIQAAVVRVLYFKDRYFEKRFRRFPYRHVAALDFIKLRSLPYLQFYLNSFRKNEFAEATKNADLLIAQGFSAPFAVNAFHGPSVLIVADESAMNRWKCWERGIYGKLKFWLRFIVQVPFYWFFCVENAKALRKASAVVAPSRYYANQLKELFKIKVSLIYPFIDFANIHRAGLPPLEKRKYIMMIGDHGSKGVGIFEKIAKLLPEEDFMVVTRYGKPGREGNITYQPYAKTPVETIEIYKKAKIMLMPSLWEEAFGQVAVEASALGIPVLVSRRGGLPETVPDDHVVEDYKDARSWVEKIKCFLDNSGQARGTGYDPWKKFCNQKQFRKMAGLIRSTTGVAIDGSE